MECLFIQNNTSKQEYLAVLLFMLSDGYLTYWKNEINYLNFLFNEVFILNLSLRWNEYS